MKLEWFVIFCEEIQSRLNAEQQRERLQKVHAMTNVFMCSFCGNCAWVKNDKWSFAIFEIPTIYKVMFETVLLIKAQ